MSILAWLRERWVPFACMGLAGVLWLSGYPAQAAYLAVISVVVLGMVLYADRPL